MADVVPSMMNARKTTGGRSCEPARCARNMAGNPHRAPIGSAVCLIKEFVG